MTKRKSLVLAVAAIAGGALLGATSASAHEAGDLIVRAGIASVQPKDSSTELALNGSAIGGSEAGVGGNEQLGITFTYMLDNHFGLELLVATPFEHDISAQTGALGLGTVDAGSTKHLPPTLTLQYFPLDPSSKFQPYVGVGVNYTTFFEEDVAGDLQGVLGNGSLKLDDSFGLSAQVGVDYQITDKLLLNAAVRYIDIDTEATFSFDSGNELKTDVAIDPVVSMISLSYKF